MNKDFLDIHKESMEHNGFWSESYMATIFRQIENAYKTEIIAEWCVSDMVIHNGKVMLKWAKRFNKLSKEELFDKYGRVD